MYTLRLFLRIVKMCIRDRMSLFFMFVWFAVGFHYGTHPVGPGKDEYESQYRKHAGDDKHGWIFHKIPTDVAKAFRLPEDAQRHSHCAHCRDEHRPRRRILGDSG